MADQGRPQLTINRLPAFATLALRDQLLQLTATEEEVDIEREEETLP
jgi:hypothetical protein